MGNIKFLFKLFLPSLFVLPLCNVLAQGKSDELLNWSVLAELPDTEGFGGAFAGVDNDTLIIAGGTNFPEEKLWEGGKKQWYAGIYVLEKIGDGLKWHTGFDLKRPIAYGGSVDTEFGLLCIGGCGKVDFSDEVFLLSWNSEKKSISIKEMPRLPKPCAYSTAAMVDGNVYLAGGKFSLSGKPEKNFWKLDLSGGIDNENLKWEVLPSWPGAGRVTALSAGQNDGFGKHFYLFGGRDVDGQGESVFLSDSYRYSPSNGLWTKIEELPRPVRSSTCIDVGQNHIMIFGGPDGSLVGKGLNADHPGFPTDILMYHTITNTWVYGGDIPVRRWWADIDLLRLKGACDMNMRKLDRRRFIKYLGIGAAGMSLPVLSAFAVDGPKAISGGTKKNNCHPRELMEQ